METAEFSRRVRFRILALAPTRHFKSTLPSGTRATQARNVLSRTIFAVFAVHPGCLGLPDTHHMLRKGPRGRSGAAKCVGCPYPLTRLSESVLGLALSQLDVRERHARTSADILRPKPIPIRAGSLEHVLHRLRWGCRLKSTRSALMVAMNLCDGDGTWREIFETDGSVFERRRLRDPRHLTGRVRPVCTSYGWSRRDLPFSWF